MLLFHESREESTEGINDGIRSSLVVLYFSPHRNRKSKTKFNTVKNNGQFASKRGGCNTNVSFSSNSFSGS